MSIEKDELIGITAEELVEIDADIWDRALNEGLLTDGATKKSVLAVALAAQKALLKEIDILAELADCEDAWQSIRIKLEVE